MVLTYHKCQVIGKKTTIEGCKSFHIHHMCKLPVKHEPTIQVSRRRAEQGDVNEGNHPEDIERKRRKKSRKYTMLGKLPPPKKRENVGILKKQGGGLPESHFHVLLFLTWENPQKRS